MDPLELLDEPEDAQGAALIALLRRQSQRQGMEREALRDTLGRQQGQAGGLRTLSMLASMGDNPLLRGIQRTSGEQGAQMEGLAARTEGRLAQIEPSVDPARVVSLRQAAERLKLQQTGQASKDKRAEEAFSLARQRLQAQQQRMVAGAATAKEKASTEQETGLRKELMGNPVTKTFMEASVAFDKVQRAASDPTPAGDLALIFGYMKVLDPGSVVKETEFANAQNAANVPDRIRNVWNRALSGERLTPEQRKDFVQSAAGQYQAQKAAYERLAKQYEGLAPEGRASRVALPGLAAETAPTAPAPQAAPARSAQDEAALKWARENPKDPRATAILQRLGVSQ